MEPLCWVLSSSWVRDRVTAQGPRQSRVYSDSHRIGQANELIVGMDARQNDNGGRPWRGKGGRVSVWMSVHSSRCVCG